MTPTFAVGETVTYTGRFDGRPLRCTIVRIMPQENDVRSYRIRGLAETFERAVPETMLAKVGPSAAERVFEH